ncbi:hypothetical protein PUN28_018550 [Cardiocondyla obscurior]|uniref:Uncharacterized protein n=1 Tax=Cardiocondyla obscurior TaxID=286306 RepID=A0AAW2EIA0_9HYME
MRTLTAGPALDQTIDPTGNEEGDREKTEKEVDRISHLITSGLVSSRWTKKGDGARSYDENNGSPERPDRET